jgi:hypothetical protein
MKPTDSGFLESLVKTNRAKSPDFGRSYDLLPAAGGRSVR